MDLQLDEKLVVVTGSTGDGIGFAIAKEFVRYGAHVIVNGRTQSSVNESVERLEKVRVSKECNKHKQNQYLLGIAGNLGTIDGINTFINEIKTVEKNIQLPVSILINNVGIFHNEDFLNISDNKWDEYYQINTMSGVRLSRYFLPHMIKHNNNGRIIFISSECAIRPLPHMLAYSISKTSQITLARGLSELTKGTTVTVNSILPGPTMTGGVRTYMKDFAKQHNINNLDDAVRQYFIEHETTSLIQRFLQPKEVADVVAFLSSPLASGINGTAQHVDGGIVRHI